MTRRGALAIATLVLAACNPTTPLTNPTPVTSDLAGTWRQVSAGGTRTWNLAQSGIQVGGPGIFSQANNPNFGAVSGSGGVVGAVVFGAFMFAETYENLSRPDCYADVNGQLTIGSNTMTGSYTEADGCAGVRVGQFTGTLTMQRQ